jgi:hypothetical protein
VFDGSGDYHARINDPSLNIDEDCMLVIRGAGPVGWPGSAEVVNMQPPDALIKRGINCAADAGRRPPVRHLGQPVDPERLAGKRGWRRPGLYAHRRHHPRRPERRPLRHAGRSGRGAGHAARDGIPALPPSQTPWQELYRATVGQMETGPAWNWLDHTVAWQTIWRAIITENWA